MCDGDVLRYAVALRVREQSARMFLGAIEVTGGNQVFRARRLVPNFVESPTVPQLAIVQRVHTLQRASGSGRLAGDRVVMNQIDQCVCFRLRRSSRVCGLDASVVVFYG